MATTTTAAAAPAAQGTAAAAAAAASSARSTSGVSGDFNTFLKLLTTQLQNQDPTNAMSPEQMTAQLVQFAGVEQQIRQNSSLEKLIGLQQTAQLTAAAPLLGRAVEVEGDRLALQDGKAVLRLPAASGNAAQAVVAVQDPASGRTVREARVALGPAATAWTWDGRDAAGTRLPDGAYRFKVQGLDAAGAPAANTVTAGVVARATGLERREGDLRLQLGPGVEVGFDRVRSVPNG